MPDTAGFRVDTCDTVLQRDLREPHASGSFLFCLLLSLFLCLYKPRPLYDTVA